MTNEEIEASQEPKRETIKTCVTCAHFSCGVQEMYGHDFRFACRRDRLSLSVDLVTGDVQEGADRDCDVERAGGSTVGRMSCGPEGRFWSQKPEPSPDTVQKQDPKQVPEEEQSWRKRIWIRLNRSRP
jgi:hypothetical protein